MEWTRTQFLDLPGKIHCGAFHPRLPLFAAAHGSSIVEFDVVTGSKLSIVDVGGRVTSLGYSPSGGHSVVAVLEDLTVRCWDLDSEHTYILSSNSELGRRGEKYTEVHLAMTPTRPWAFFAAHKKSSVYTVGTVEGIRPATSIKTEVKKPVTALACHPRQPILFICHSDGTIRAHSAQSLNQLYVLQMDDVTVKLAGASALIFHPTEDFLIVADRSGSLLAWDLTGALGNLIGFTQASDSALVSGHWHSTLGQVIVATEDGHIQAWRVSPAGVHNGTFFEKSDIEQLDIERIMSRQLTISSPSSQTMRSFLLHPAFNYATVLFEDEVQESSPLSRYSRESRKQLLETLQRVRSSGERSAIPALLDKAGLLKEQQFQKQADTQPRAVPTSAIDFARKAALYGSATDKKSAAASAATFLPILSILDPKDPIQDLPLCHPFQSELTFFSSPVGVFPYPSRLFLVRGNALLAHSMVGPGMGGTSHSSKGKPGVQLLTRLPSESKVHGGPMTVRHVAYSAQQQSLLVIFSCGPGKGEVHLIRSLDWNEPLGEGLPHNEILDGKDGCWTGPHDSQFATLDEDGLGLCIHGLPGAVLPAEPAVRDIGYGVPPGAQGLAQAGGRAALSEDDFVSRPVVSSASRFDEELDEDEPAARGRPGAFSAFLFATQVERIFSAPMAGSLLYVCAGSHLGVLHASMDRDGREDGDFLEVAGQGRLLNTRRQEEKHVRLHRGETVLQVAWQGSPFGHMAGVMTNQRVLILNSKLETMAVTVASGDLGYPPFRSLLWVGPSLLFSTSTAVSSLGWDSQVRPLITLHNPNSVLLCALNDRLLLAHPCAPDPEAAPAKEASKKAGKAGSVAGSGMVEVRARLVGLLEPLLLGWVTLAQTQGSHSSVDLADLLLCLTARFDNQRVTPRLVQVLSRGPPVCSDLAFELAQSGAQFSADLRIHAAVRARKFREALQVLRDLHSRSPEYPRCPPNSRLFLKFRQLGQACVKYGQFDVAKAVFAAAGDLWSEVDVFIAHMNPSALRHLSAQLELSPAGDGDRSAAETAGLKRAVDQVLLVRSSMWSRAMMGTGVGGFQPLHMAAGMAPRDQAWGGGDWPLLLLPESEKPFPQWELSGSEVTAYMKTPAGAIPVVQPDSLGVYLGTEEGRGTVVEVQGLTPVQEEVPRDGGPRDVESAAAAVFLKEGDSVAKRLLAGHLAGDQAGDGDQSEAQRRAEEEFKLGFAGTGAVPGDVSSDEEEEGEPGDLSKSGSGRWKISIRKKGSDAPSVRESIDMSRLASAAQSLRLAELPLSRSASRSTANPSLPPVPASPGVTFKPVWADLGSPAVSQGSVGGVPPQAVSLGYALPQYPPTPVSSMVPGVPPGGTLGPGPTPSNTPAQALPPAELFESEAPFQAVSGSEPPLSSGVPPQAEPKQESPAQEFGGLLGGPQEERKVPRDDTLPAGVTDLREVMDVSAITSQPITAVPAEQELGPLASLGPQASSGAGATTQAVTAGFVPRGQSSAVCFKAGVAHLEASRLSEARACLDEAFLALAKDRSLGTNVSTQAKICAHYKLATILLQELARLQKAEGGGAVGARAEMARLSRHLASLPLQARHRISCVRTAVARNMEVHNWRYAHSQLALLLEKAPPNRQKELRALSNVCSQRGLTDKTIEAPEDPSKFCAQTLGRLSTIGHDTCDTCGSNFSALASPGCPVCGMGTVRRSDARLGGLYASPF